MKRIWTHVSSSKPSLWPKRRQVLADLIWLSQITCIYIDPIELVLMIAPRDASYASRWQPSRLTCSKQDFALAQSAQEVMQDLHILGENTLMFTLCCQGELECCISGCERTSQNYKLNGTSAGKEFTSYANTSAAICNPHRQALNKGWSLQLRNGEPAVKVSREARRRARIGVGRAIRK